MQISTKYQTRELHHHHNLLYLFLDSVQLNKTVSFEAKIQYKPLIRLVTRGYLSSRSSLHCFGLVSNWKRVHFLYKWNKCSMHLCLMLLKTTFHHAKSSQLERTNNFPEFSKQCIPSSQNWCKHSFDPTSSLQAIPADVSASSVPACGKCQIQPNINRESCTIITISV